MKLKVTVLLLAERWIMRSIRLSEYINVGLENIYQGTTDILAHHWATMAYHSATSSPLKTVINIYNNYLVAIIVKVTVNKYSARWLTDTCDISHDAARSTDSHQRIRHYSCAMKLFETLNKAANLTLYILTTI